MSGSSSTVNVRGPRSGDGAAVIAPALDDANRLDVLGGNDYDAAPVTYCGTCHSGYTATTVNRATHVDGILQVTSPLVLIRDIESQSSVACGSPVVACGEITSASAR